MPRAVPSTRPTTGNRLSRIFARLLPAAALCAAFIGSAADGESQRVVSAVLERLRAQKTPAEIERLTAADVRAFLTPAERQVLGTRHLSFQVSAPVTVVILLDASTREIPFWLQDQGFRPTGRSVTVDTTRLEAWEKTFPAGQVALGVNSLSGGGQHYVIALRANSTSADGGLRVTKLRPTAIRLGRLEVGEKPYTDGDQALTEVPRELSGITLVRVPRARRDDAKVLGRLRLTEYPSAPRPDHVLLTWADDPATTQSIQWRTHPHAQDGFVEYWPKPQSTGAPAPRPQVVRASTHIIETPDVVNDPAVRWHTARLRGLEPGTVYAYRVGGDTTGWYGPAEFRTAPASPTSFAFVYLGDAQTGLDRWGALLTNAFVARPDAAFYLMAGDLVNRGAERDDWDRWFHHARGIYDRRPIVPVIGNHDCQGGSPRLYLQFFDLPGNGPIGVERERAYSFHYGNTLMVVLDSNLPPGKQAAWLDRTLAASKATWKFVSFHHPVYSPAITRDNRKIRETWGPIFDKHHVDLVLQGHDHSYLRTRPMRAGQPVSTPQEGTIYVVAVSGAKHYAQLPHKFRAVGISNVSTWQVLDLRIEANQLEYRAYDDAGRLRDGFVIQK